MPVSRTVATMNATTFTLHQTLPLSSTAPSVLSHLCAKGTTIEMLLQLSFIWMKTQHVVVQQLLHGPETIMLDVSVFLAQLIRVGNMYSKIRTSNASHLSLQ